MNKMPATEKVADGAVRQNTDYSDVMTNRPVRGFQRNGDFLFMPRPPRLRQGGEFATLHNLPNVQTPGVVYDRPQWFEMESLDSTTVHSETSWAVIDRPCSKF